MAYFDSRIKDGAVVLDAFAGDNAFYNNYPSRAVKRRCEIDDGIDFFAASDKADWIITNPPYSQFSGALTHCMGLADHVVLLVPLNKIVSSVPRTRQIFEYGGFKDILVFDPKDCNFRMGFPVCAVHIERGYGGECRWVNMTG